MKWLFVFVEGPDDERFITSILSGYNIKVVKYAHEKKDSINSYIRSIRHIPNCDYIVICDIDLKSLKQKKDEILSLFPDCETDKIIVSIAEIESWYIAGVDKSTAQAMKIKYMCCTDTITKEKFNQMVPAKMDRINFMIEILKKYNLDEAPLRNKSLKFFLEYLAQVEK